MKTTQTISFQTVSIFLAVLGVISQVAASSPYKDGDLICYDGKWSIDAEKPIHLGELTKKFCNEEKGHMMTPVLKRNQTISVQTAEGKPFILDVYMMRHSDRPEPAAALDANLCTHLFDRLIRECPGQKSDGDLRHFKDGVAMTLRENGHAMWSALITCDRYSGHCPGW
ncbi:hypothetical protein AJ79_09359 [Helicocarpus griseus UAMH5409]|uniref:Ecp2 effector protein domain-containing protein n=1 Tax=Helicocarpus griseus UAMH5409 TaxID=1447875 RepID=A0A2B7WJW6_9EURO|nr:hypothetical protein AJ79_09359 [Helicocarpus griseus UAMH5409]